ncbi:MAG TPA: SDR family NAD(P)-dependent oxidoreductase, partial [Polyangium sp.]|nr:SDR family NAD(P)-dependent oxidoreductase [Polyangium sp.]
MSKEGGPQNPKRRDPLTQEATALQRAIAALEKMKARLDSVESASSEPIAIIGMACRFPGEGEGPDAFWNVLDQGIDAVREIPESRWPASVISGEPQDTRWAALLDDLSTFDAAFFGISPREAETLDPQQRMLLEMTWEALENAGVRPEKLIGSRTGVFIGISNNDYQLLVNDARSSQYDAYCGTGNLFSTAAGRISFVFGFQGPAVSMDTACSSSLVAISQGCQSLRAGDADLVVTGGVNAILSWHTMALLHATQALSADGRCKTFDARANGYARGEGCGIIVLKRLSDALRDGDNIRGLIRGWAINQDGRSSGLTAPNVLSQQTMLRQALVRAKLTPTDIDYVEVHGTGTSLGDPIEVDALREVLGGPRADGSKCVLGAVKTNIGHLESAAGVAGIIKILLCLEHGAIPKNLHFRRLNPRISLDGTPLVIPTETIPWPRGNKPRRAGVSAFGMSGTNAHIILEEALPDKPHESIPEYAAYLLPLSAKNLQALRALAKSYTKWFAAEHDVPLYDVMYTATERRTHHEYRLAVAANSPKEFADLLEQFALGQTPARVVYGQASSQETPRVVFVFSGQGSQWAEMGKTLLEEEPVFRAQVEEIDALVRHHARFSVVDELCAPVGRSRLDETEVVQPTLFALQVGLVALLDSWGIAPDAVIGHSVGEVAAAYASGALALEDAVRLVVWRGRIMQQATGLGKMVWVALPEAEASLTITGLEDKLAIAAVNDPNSVVLSGETNAVEVVVADLEKRGIATRALRVNYAFHSPQMAPLARDLVTRLGRSTAKPTKITMYSTLTGKRIEGNALVAEYWGLNVLSTVNLASAVHSALQDETNIFIEVGPHPVLVASIEQCTANQKRDIHVISVLRRQFGGRRAALEVIASLHTRGFDVDWKKFLPIDGRVVPLPTYSWQRQRYWLETSESSPKKTASDPINELFYAVQWRQKGHAAERATKTGGNGKYFIFGHGPRAETFIQLLESQKRSCILVRSGSRFARLTPTSFTIDLDNPVHYDDVFREGLRQDERCAGIIYLFPADQLTIHELTEDSVNGALTWNFFAVISLIRTLSAQKWRSRPPLWLVTRGAVTVAEEPISSPIHTALWSLGRTIDLENPEIDCRRVDLAPNVAEDDAARSLFLEIDTGDGENQVAIRNGERFVARIGQTRLPPRSEMQFTLRGDATYLITGGLGGLGLTIAQWMAGVGARNIALVGRREPSADARTRIQQIEATYGARVLVFQANVAQRSSIAAVFADLAISAPPIVGIVHAAGVATESMPLAETRRDAFAKVMASKAIGALHLHTLSLPLALEFFVLYSSASAVLGLVGQASYSAANAFLDAMAAWRASHGLPAMSIQWGAFATVGMVADKEIQNRITSGMTALTADDGTMVLSRLLEHPRPHISVMKFVPRQWLDLFPQLAAIPYFADLMQAPHTSATVRSSTNDQRFREKLAATKESERMTLLEEHVRRTLSQILKLPENEIGKRSPFQTLGVDSLMSLELRNRLESSIGVKLPATLLFTYVHLEALTTFLLAECDLTTDSAMEPVAATSVVIAAEENEPIAIIGQACRFPGGGTNPERFWQSLIEGVDAIREVMPTRWPRGTIPEGNPGASYAALLDDIDQFDAAFFGISPREAEALDPQQRMLLEVTWEALENAGVPAERLSGSKTGVYVGITGLDYQHLVLDHPEHLDAYGATGTMLATAAGRLSYVFGLQGPAIALDTACSSSLVTVHLACQSLRNGGISLAIAGGANALLAWQTMVMLSSMRALSIDGRCKTLDARANGYVRGEGCGIVVLKRLADALRDGDRILGLIRGSATNQDGRSTGLTTPNVLAQKDLLLQALDNAHLTSEDIGYLELHGTGTPLGDPIEADALRAVFGKTRSDASNLYLGALKTNIGHLESAAGVASVIKVLSVLQHERIPANLHFHALNPRISFDGMPFVIPTASTIWPRNDKPRRAGVSAFGMSGTNAHIILEEAPHQPATLSSESTGYLLPISAKTPTALQKLAQSYSHWLADHQDVSLYDLAYTASLRRTHHEHRLTTVAKTSKEFSDLLGAFARGEAPSGISYNHISAQHEPQIVFVFSGQGSQWAGMGKTLLDAEPVFNDKLIEIDALVGKYATFSIVAELRSPEESSRLDATEIVQPTLFALQVALVELLRSWGVTPAAVIGHSIGEVTAAHVSGALTLEDAVRLVILRGQIMQRATGHGKMVWAGMPVAEAEYAITEFADKLSIAAINDPASVVLSGETAFLDTLVATLNKRGLVTRPLRVNYAFHSPQMNTLAEELTTRLQRLDTQTNSITLYSTVTGTPIDGNALGPEYWGRNVR